MRSLVLAAFLALLSVPAFAAYPPNLVGTWIPVEHSGARVGPREGYTTSTTPTLSHDLHLAWKLVIESQDGPAFAGHNVGPSGKSTQVVGVVREDGTRFVMATEGGSASGEIMGDRLEFCVTDNIPVYVGAICTIYKRAPAIFNILGSWTPVAAAAARVGTSDAYDAPTLVLEKASPQPWSIVFDQQDGAAFSGMATGGPKTTKHVTVGVFRMDGKRFVFSSDTGAGTGEVVDQNQIQLCFTDNLDNFVAASCTTLQRK
jgi:hypothetical protein